MKLIWNEGSDANGMGDRSMRGSGSLVVKISASHAEDPDSNSGRSMWTAMFYFYILSRCIAFLLLHVQSLHTLQSNCFGYSVLA